MAWGLFLAAFMSMFCVLQPYSGWNVNSRLSLIFAVVDQQTVSIDDYHDREPTETGDKAFYAGHFYSDKIFGVSLLGVPIYAILRLVCLPFGEPSYNLASHVIRVGAVSLPAAASLVLLWLMMIRSGAAPRRALLAVGFAFWGSLWFGYSNVFYPYATGGAALLAALWLIMNPRAHRLTPRNSFVIGLLCGYSVLCDMIFGLMAAGVGVVYLLRAIDQAGFAGFRAFADMKGERSTGREALGLSALAVIGGLLPLLLFAAYCYSIFGEFSIPYKYEADDLFRLGMSQGFMGVTTPDPNKLWFLTLHPYRGLFFWSPVFLIAIAGLVRGIRSTGKRRLYGWLGMWGLVSYFLFNASYYMWWGGEGMGSRLLLPMVPFLAMGLGELCRRDAHRLWWIVLVVLGSISVLASFPISLIDPQVPPSNQTADLIHAHFGDNLHVPQFIYWKAFFTSNGYMHPKFGFQTWRAASVIGALFFLVFFMTRAIRRCPEKHYPYERLEVPFVNFDGNKAPLPEPRGR